MSNYFVSHSGNPLFYERRSRQFVSRTIEKQRVVTPLGLVKAFSSTFLEEPHKTARDFGSVLRKIPAEIFNESHKYEPYYFAALAYYWVEYLIRKEKIRKNLRSARYQILLAFRLFNEVDELPALNSKKIVGYVNKLIPLLKDATSAEKAFKTPVEIVEGLLSGNGSDEPRTSSFTQLMKNAVQSNKRKFASKPVSAK